MTNIDHIMEAGYPGLPSDIIHAFEAGSALHGASLSGKSDFDLAGVFIEAPIRRVGLHKIDHFVTSTGSQDTRNTKDDKDFQFQSLGHWATLASAGNPTILASAFAPPLPGVSNVWTNHILPNIHYFMATRHANAFRGYATNQFHRMQKIKGAGKHGQRPELENEFGFDTKAAMHMIRLTYEGIELMQTGRITFPRPEKELLLEIRKGEWQQAKVEAHFLDLEQRLRDAEAESSLPQKVDLDKISTLVATAYLSHWRTHDQI